MKYKKYEVLVKNGKGWISNRMKVSIITPCLNSGKTIEETVKSVLGQTYQNVEYIIVDGGSTDQTIEILDKYCSVSKGRLKYISEKDDGIYDAMNKGILRASGDVIGIINSDDWYETDAIEMIVDCFNKSNADVVFGEIWLIDLNGKRRSCTKNSTLPPHPAMFVRRNIYQKYGMFDANYAIAADYELTLRLLSKGVIFERVDKILSNFRTSGISSIRKRECIEETYQINLKYADRRLNGILNKNIAEELYRRSMLLYISQHSPEKILTVLRQKFPELEQGIIIFGTGSWGQELHTVLKNCHVNISFFVDNDDKKWDFDYAGTRIYSPEILKGCRGYVFIAMKKYQKEVRDQIFSYARGNLMVDTYDRLWEAVHRDEEL